MREPAIAWWPGKIKPGGVTRELACSMDLFNTCLALGRAAMPGDRPIDGVDLSALLFQGGKSLRDTMFYYRGDQLFAIRKGVFKAHFETAPGYGSPGAPVKFEKHDPPLLFNLASDPSERFEIGRDYPAIVADLKQQFDQHRANVVPGPAQY